MSNRWRRREGGGLSALIGALGGDSHVLAIYDARKNVVAAAGLVQTWDDARGPAGFGPQIVGFGATKPAYDGVSKITTSGANWLQTTKQAAFDLGGATTTVLLGATQAGGGFPVTLADDPYTNPIAYMALVNDDGSHLFVNGLQTLGPRADGATRRLYVIYRANGLTAVGNGSLTSYGEVWGRAHAVVDGNDGKTAGTRALCIGGLPNSGALAFGTSAIVQFILHVDHQISAAEHDAILAYVAAVGLAPTYDSSASAIFCHGNSRTLGTGSTTPGGATAYPAVLQSTHAALSGYDVLNMGIGGRQAVTMLAQVDGIVCAAYNAARAKNFYIHWELINDLGTGGYSAAQALAHIQGACQAAKSRGFKVVVCTEIPWASDGLCGGFNAQRLSVNTSIRSAVTNGWADAVVDLAANTNLQTPSNATYFNADFIHLVDAGYVEVVNNATNGIWTQLNALGV